MKLIALSLLLLLLSCQEAKQNKTLNTTKQENKLIKVHANDSIQLNVSGMVCEKGCVASIRKELILSQTVEKCIVDFKPKEKIQQVKILFDNTRTDSTKLVSLIESVNEKQFKVYF